MLAVDDDDGIRTLLEVTLSLDERFELVGVAASAAETRAMVERAGAAAIDAVVVDVSLPDMNGIDLLAELRQTLPKARLALFTGWSDSETVARATAAGADQVFAKDGNLPRLINGLYDLTS